MENKPLKLYSSSAGSGKTFTLALSYIELAVKNPMIYRNILAVTFTNKATQEMKFRIVDYLFALAEGKGDTILAILSEKLNYSEEKIRHNAALALKNILHNYPLFSVTTIDSYFQRVIQAFSRELGLQGGFDIELDHDIVLNDLVERMMLDVGTNQQLTDWLIRFSEVRVDEGKSWDVRQEIKNLAREIFNEGFKRFETEIKNNREAIPDLLKNVTGVIRAFEEKLKAYGKEGLDIMKRFDLKISDFSHASTGVAGFLKKLASGQVIAPAKRVEEALRDPNTLYKKNHSAGPAICEAYEHGLHRILQEIVDLFEEQQVLYQTALAINRYIYTLGLLTDISLKLQDYREENQTLLISDLSDFLRRIINENETPFIYEKTGSRFRHFLIDEFQDTSGFQWENFRPLISNSLAEGSFNLTVGDVKQSIYRWRGGNWELLLRQIKEDLGNNLIESKRLNTNRRSKKFLIRFFNALFEQAPEKLRKTFLSSVASADKKVSEAIKAEADKIIEAYQDALQYIPDEKELLQEGKIRVKFYEDTEDSSWKEQALSELPRLIEELQDSGYAPRDIAILVRTKEEGEEAVECLMNHKASEAAREDCSYETVSSESLFLTAAHAVKILISAMSYAKNQQDDIALVNLVYEYVTFLKKESTLPLEELFIQAKSPEFIKQNNLLPQTFWDDLLYLQVLPAYEAAEKLIRTFDLRSLTGESAYLLAFLDLILEYTSRENGELAGFLDWWETTGINRSIEMPEEIDAIRVMTIHKSKGLQFKAVLIPFAVWNLDHNPMFDNIIWRVDPPAPFDQPGCLPVRYTKALEHTLFNMDYYEEKIKAAIDNLNLAYVAFTRAEDQLIVYGCRPSNPAAVSIKNISDLLYAIFSEEADPAPLPANQFPVMNLKKYWNETAGIFEAGQARQTESITPQPALRLNKFISVGWRDKLSVRYRSGETGRNASESLKYGNLIHNILSKTETTGNLEKILQEVYYEGLLTKNELSEIRQKLMAILEKDPVKDWFSGKYKLKTEAATLSPGGEIRRMDRVMFDSDRAIVVDFKTGAKNQVYHRQLQEYSTLLRNMGYRSVEAYILYLDEAEVEEVGGE